MNELVVVNIFHTVNSNKNNSIETKTEGNYYYNNYTTNVSYENVSFYGNLSYSQIMENMSFVLPLWRQILWTILFGTMIVIATFGNLIVIWIVLTNKRMRTVTNYFIVNLSFADVMVSSLNVTFNYFYMLDNDWIFGDLYCKISQFIATLSISASVLTLMAISIDRYIAIVQPLKPRMSKRNNLTIAAGIWLISAIIAIPMLLFFTTGHLVTENGSRTVCYSEWPDGTTNHSQHEYLYNIFFTLLTYFLPIISMTFTYTRIGIKLWSSKTIGERTIHQIENISNKRRIVKMLMVIVIIFAVCWLPFHVYFIVTSCYPIITQSRYIQEIYLMIYWMAMSNSMYNPIIYCWMNARFRRGFKLFFLHGPFTRIGIGAESIQRFDNRTSHYSSRALSNHELAKHNAIMGRSTSVRAQHVDIGENYRSKLVSSQSENQRFKTGIKILHELTESIDLTQLTEIPLNK